MISLEGLAFFFGGGWRGAYVVFVFFDAVILYCFENLLVVLYRSY